MCSILSDPVTLATVVIAIATVVNVIVSWFLWKATHRTANVTQNIFEAAHRPYLMSVLSADWRVEQQRFNFNTEIRNFGSVPARKLKGRIIATLGNREVKSWDDISPISLYLLPQQPIEFPSWLDGDDFTDLWEHAAELRISVDVQYSGAGEQTYLHSETYVISRVLEQFHFCEDETAN
jgi:hypothetical protein